MSEDAPESAAGETPADKPARKRPARRVAKPAATPEAATPPAGIPEAPVETIHPVEFTPEPIDNGSSDPIAVIVEPPSADASPSSKKRRRKKKKHGQQTHPNGPAPAAESAPESGFPASEIHTPAMHAAPRPKLDAEHVAKKAWKIFLAEVSEEGLALIGDQDAREISRRSFRLAEIFLEEEARRGR